MNLADQLDTSAKRFPDKLAVVSEDEKMTYAGLKGAVDGLASAMNSLGISRGDRVAVMLPNGPDFVASYYAIVKMGAVAVTLNVMSTPYELVHVMRDCRPKVLITIPQLAAGFTRARKMGADCDVLITSGDCPGAKNMRHLISAVRRSFSSEDMAPDDPAVIIYTAGLCGRSMGAVLTHNNLISNSEVLELCADGTESEVGAAVVPFFHSFGATVNMNCFIRLGATICTMKRFDVALFFKLLEENKVTFIAAVPALFFGMVRHPLTGSTDLSNIRLCVSGGSKLQPPVMEAFRKKFPFPLLEGYGLTEASPVSTFCRTYREYKPGSVGQPVCFVEVRVRGESGENLDPGGKGEVVVKGPNVMKGYLNSEEGTKQVIKDGWLYTGDLGYMDEHGYLFLTGHKKDMIITSSFNVYPPEVEEVLNNHPAVEEGAVVGAHDPVRGEAIKAFVVLKKGERATEKDIVRHCREYLSAYKVPRTVEFLPELPKDSGGRVLKEELIGRCS